MGKRQKSATNTSRTGLLIVHGIGEQRQGETSEKLVKGLSRLYGSDVQVERGADNLPVTLTAAGQTVRIYEVYWADILSGERVANTFRWDLILSLGWFPWLNWKTGRLPRNLYSRTLVVLQTLLLLPITLLLYPIYLGARILAQFAGTIFRKSPPPEVEVDEDTALARLAARSRIYADRAAKEPTWVEEILDTFAGDVTNYMAALGDPQLLAGREDLQQAAVEIHQRFYAAVAAAEKDGCGEIQILAHSLGTVIAYHALTGLVLKPAANLPNGRTYQLASRLTRFYTIGSPLEKIRFFWPGTISEKRLDAFKVINEQAAAIPGAQPSESRIRWDNFHHAFDLVSGRLKRFDHWGKVTNHAIRGSGGMIRSHVIYESSPTFLEIISAGLFGTTRTLSQSLTTRTVNRLSSIGENLLLPLALLLLLIVGILMGLLTAFLPGYFISLPFRLLGWDAWVNTIQNFFAVIMLIVIAVQATFGVHKTAREMHRLWANRQQTR